MKIAQFTDGLATQYGQLFKALSNWEAFGPNYSQERALDLGRGLQGLDGVSLGQRTP